MMRRTILIIILTFAVCHGVACSQSKMIDEIKNHQSGIKIWWAGHNSWIIKSDTTVIATDLFLSNANRKEKAPITPHEIAQVLDVSFITHSHDDHFNRHTTETLLEKSNCLFVIPESCLHKAEELNLPKDRIVIATPRESFELHGIKVDALRAIHGNENFSIYYEANLQDTGYLIELDGISFLQPGDTYLLEDHLFLEHVDVLFFSPTEHNMYIDRSIILINRLNPDYVFPQHHSTIQINDSNRFWAKGYQEEVKLRLSQELKQKYHILKPGDSWIIQNE